MRDVREGEMVSEGHEEGGGGELRDMREGEGGEGCEEGGSGEVRDVREGEVVRVRDMSDGSGWVCVKILCQVIFALK